MTERLVLRIFVAFNDEGAYFYVPFFTPCNDGKFSFSYNNGAIKKQK
jgi:hypothetical protein